MATHGVHDMDSGSDDLAKVKTSGAVSIPAELYEKLYLSPQVPKKGAIVRTVGNPTPLAIIGFLLAAGPLGFILLGIRGSGGAGQAIIGPVYMFGGVLQLIGCIMEWAIGNTFGCAVFGSFGAFWLGLGITLTPSFNAVKWFEENAATPEEGVAMFYASFAFFLLCMGILTTVYLICAFCTNVVFVIVFLFITVALELLAAAYWNLALGEEVMAENLEKAAGGCACVFNAAGAYLGVVQLFEAVRFPIRLPVGDLSRRFARSDDADKAA